MERGYIRIKENRDNQLIVEAKLVNCTLWMTKHEIADLLNVFVSSVGNNLQAIFKSDILREEDVTRIHKSENNGRQCEVTEYNLEALIFVSYRIASYEARGFSGVGNESSDRIYPDETQKRSRSIDYI
jgi:hypothetical protein